MRAASRRRPPACVAVVSSAKAPPGAIRPIGTQIIRPAKTISDRAQRRRRRSRAGAGRSPAAPAPRRSAETSTVCTGVVPVHGVPVEAATTGRCGRALRSCPADEHDTAANARNAPTASPRADRAAAPRPPIGGGPPARQDLRERRLHIADRQRRDCCLDERSAGHVRQTASTGSPCRSRTGCSPGCRSWTQMCGCMPSSRPTQSAATVMPDVRPDRRRDHASLREQIGLSPAISRYVQ